MRQTEAQLLLPATLYPLPQGGELFRRLSVVGRLGSVLDFCGKQDYRKQVLLAFRPEQGLLLCTLLLLPLKLLLVAARACFCSLIPTSFLRPCPHTRAPFLLTHTPVAAVASWPD
jgi:hypothetical protein